MKIKILGLQKREGESRKTGKPYNGVIVYGVASMADVVGQGTIEQYIDNGLWSPAMVDYPSYIGREATLSYGPRGFVDGFEVAPGK